MSTGQTVREQFIDGLGLVFGKEFSRLYGYWGEAWMQFEEYSALFNDEKNVVLLNAIGGQIFGVFQQIMLDSLILHITRLTDSHESGRNRYNLSIQILPDRLQKGQNIKEPERFKDPNWIAELERLVVAAKDSADPARRHRNERIAHLDYSTTMGNKSATPLPKVHFGDLKRALDDIYKVFNFVLTRMDPRSHRPGKVIYRSGAQRFLAYERNRIDFILYLDSRVDTETESDTRAIDFADMVIEKFNVNRDNLNYSDYWKLMDIFGYIGKDVQYIRDTGITGPITGSS